MSRAAKATLAGSILVSGLTVWGVHYMQVQERETMQRGVDRDSARLAEKASKRQKEAEQQARAQEHDLNRAREQAWQKMQPSAGYLKGER